jgi:Tol biopolymer transport system component
VSRVLLGLFCLLVLAGCSQAGGDSAPQSGSLSAEGPLPWADRHLSGRLILISYSADGNTLVSLDLTTGKMETLFQAPKNSTLLSASVSPDEKQVLLDYAPPPAGNGVNLGYTDLYLMPLEGERTPRPLLTRRRPVESFYFSAWAPDGKSILYSHFFQEDSQPPTYRYQIERLPLGGVPQTLAADALWPRLSPDSSRLAYLSYNADTGGNELYLADPDGKNSRTLLPPGAFVAEDAHVFTPDSQAILFSAVNPASAPAFSWFDRLAGVQVASAHSVPSDWYRVDLSGGQPLRLTHIGDTGMYGRFSPDGQDVAFISYTGLYLMKPDGRQLLQIGSMQYVGSLDWIP